MAINCPFDITPYAQSQVLVRPNIFNLNYTNQDFWSMKSRLVDYVKQNFSTDFNDFVESSIAVMLIENWAFIADTLSFKIDQIANEVFIDTVAEIENAFRLSRLVGFQPQPPIASRSLWTATINNPLLSDVTIPGGFGTSINAGERNIRVELFPCDADNNPILDQDIVIPAGNVVNASVVGLEGQTYTQEFVGNGTVGQTLTIQNFPVVWESVRVKVDGVLWEPVEYFTDSQPRREYRVEYDSDYRAYVIFGNNRAGLLPPNRSRITVTYRKGGGKIGNIVAGFVEVQSVVNVPGLPVSVSVSFRNYTKGEFGYDGDTIEDVRRKLPAWIRTQNRAVTGLDYKTLADQFATPYQGQIGKSTAALRHHGCAGNVIELYVLALEGDNGLEECSTELKSALREEIESKKMFTDFLCIRDGTVIATDVVIEVVMDKFYRKFEEEYKERINRKLERFFGLNNWEYGKTLRDTDLVKDLSDIREVTRFEMNFVTDSEDNSGSTVTAKFNEIIRPDTIEISFSYE